MRHVYSMVRFVPDSARGEFINVGANVGSEESSEWQVWQIENPKRARFIDERGTPWVRVARLDSCPESLSRSPGSVGKIVQ